MGFRHRRDAGATCPPPWGNTSTPANEARKGKRRSKEAGIRPKAFPFVVSDACPIVVKRVIWASQNLFLNILAPIKTLIFHLWVNSGQSNEHIWLRKKSGENFSQEALFHAVGMALEASFLYKIGLKSTFSSNCAIAEAPRRVGNIPSKESHAAPMGSGRAVARQFGQKSTK